MSAQRASRNQCGAVALLPALLLTLVISSLLATLFYTHQLEISRATRQLHGDNALLLALSTESLARSLLARDRQLSELDTLNESWARPLPAVAVDDAQVTACLHDAQAKLNLNSFRGYDSGRLAAETGDSSRGSLASVWLAIRDRVLRAQNRAASDGRLSLDRLIDFIDADPLPVSRLGGEDELYARATPARRASNQALSQLAELELVDGWEAVDIGYLHPYVDVLPTATRINVNTAPVAVLEALSSRLDATATRQLAATRPWRTLADFHAAVSLLTGIPPTQVAAEIPAELTALQSDYFSLQMFIEIGSARLLAESLLQRSGGDVGVVRRELRWVPALAPEIAGPDVCGLEEG